MPVYKTYDNIVSINKSQSNRMSCTNREMVGMFGSDPLWGGCIPGGAPGIPAREAFPPFNMVCGMLSRACAWVRSCFWGMYILHNV